MGDTPPLQAVLVVGDVGEHSHDHAGRGHRIAGNLPLGCQVHEGRRGAGQQVGPDLAEAEVALHRPEVQHPQDGLVAGPELQHPVGHGVGRTVRIGVPVPVRDQLAEIGVPGFGEVPGKGQHRRLDVGEVLVEGGRRGSRLTCDVHDLEVAVGDAVQHDEGGVQQLLSGGESPSPRNAAIRCPEVTISRGSVGGRHGVGLVGHGANRSAPHVSDAVSGTESGQHRGGVGTQPCGRRIGVPGPGWGRLHAGRGVDHPAVAQQPPGRTGQRHVD